MAKMRKTFALLLLALCIIRSGNASDSSDEDVDTTTDSSSTTFISTTQQSTTTTKQEEQRPKLQKIYTLDDNCAENHCTNFHYDGLDEVAFFDLKAEVRINNGDSTYDIINSRDYDVLLFENSTFARFPLQLFYSLHIKELDMRNCSIQIVTWDSFIMADQLQILLLSDNQIEYIDELTFKFAAELEYLFLNANRLKSLHSDSFSGLRQLKFLDLRNNQLKQLPPGIFDDLSLLQELHLDNNRLRIISNELFTQNKNLLMLTLSANQLWRLGDEALRAQTQLTLLDVSYNKPLRTLVTSLNADHLVAVHCSLSRVNVYGRVRNVDLSDNQIVELYFTQPEQLEMLNLRNNSLEQIVSLTRVHKLLVLNLGDNPRLGTLPVPWLANSLQRLDLGNTGLTQLPIAALADQAELRYLNVSHNKLREINPTNFKYLEKLVRFDINGNDWNCFNLNLMMDILIKPHDIVYGRDRFDAEFPGEYINDIACMYRVEEPEQSSETSSSQDVIQELYDQLGSSAKQIEQLQESDAVVELQRLRQEFKAVVGFFEQKFDKAFDLIRDLNARLAEFERINATYWQHVTITV